MQRIEIRAAAQPVFRNKPQLIITMSAVAVLNANRKQMMRTQMMRTQMIRDQMIGTQMMEIQMMRTQMMRMIKMRPSAQPIFRNELQLIITISTVVVLNSTEKQVPM